MMKIVRSFAVFSFIASPLLAQQGIHVSNTDPRWGEKITVGYIAPGTSAFAKPDCKDTLFCAALIEGTLPRRAIILPMHHTSGASYEAALTVPDSTTTIRVEIGTPQAILPDGSHAFTCRTADGKPTPGYESESFDDIDGALVRELAAYPKYYRAYFHAYDFGHMVVQEGGMNRSDSAWKVVAGDYIGRMTKSPDTTIEYFITLAALYARADDDSMASVALLQASHCTASDPIVNDAMFWGRFFYPQMKNGKYKSSAGAARVLVPLFVRFPRTAMVAGWLDMSQYDTLMPVAAFRNIANAWSTSHDVDALESIADAYGWAKSPLYDPAQAMLWCERADNSLRSGSGFYSGEYVYGFEGRLGRIAALKIGLLDGAGKIDEAVTYAHAVMTQVKDLDDKREIGLALAKAYLHAGRIDDAKRAYGEQLALGTNSKLDGLKELYEKSKDGNETLSDFSKRLTKQYGGKTELPVIPDFTFKTLDGMSGTLAGLRGKVVVLDCWFISCPGCNIEKASLNKLVESFHGDTNVVFLSIATDGEKALRHFIEKTESKFKIVPNGYPICQKIGVTGFPTHIIIGMDGRTLGNELGGSEHEDEQMRPKILEALGKS